MAAPRREMERACAFLGVEYDPAMLDVYEERGRRMTDGLREAGYMLGDKKFHTHRTIDPAVGERWREEGEQPVMLSEETRALAEEARLRVAGESPKESASAGSGSAPDARSLTPVEVLPRPSGGQPALFPASLAQERLWFLSRLMPDNPFYNLSKALRLCGRLDLDALKRTLAEVTRRHEVLRTSFTEGCGPADAARLARVRARCSRCTTFGTCPPRGGRRRRAASLARTRCAPSTSGAGRSCARRSSGSTRRSTSA